MTDRAAEAAEIARALGLSADSIGRYAREGRIPFDTTPGGHRRFSLGEVRLALGTPDAPEGRAMFSVPSASLRRRALRSVVTAEVQGDAGRDLVVTSGADALLASAWRVQRSVPMLPA